MTRLVASDGIESETASDPQMITTLAKGKFSLLRNHNENKSPESFELTDRFEGEGKIQMQSNDIGKSSSLLFLVCDR